MSVLVFIPTQSDIHGLTTAAAFRLCAGFTGGASFFTLQGQPVSRCRNLAGRELLAGPHQHILFIDSDVVPPDDCLERMLAADHPFVTAPCPIHLPDEGLCMNVARRVDENAYEHMRHLPDTPFEADATGFGCCLVARSVFEQLEDPWFHFLERPDGGQTGEDIFFCQYAATLGIRPLVLPDVRCGHVRAVNLLELYDQIIEADVAHAPSV